MNPKEFVVYLNGAVEMGGLKEVEGDNFVTLKSKLGSVIPDTSKQSNFCAWLEGVIDMLDEPKISTTQFAKVITKMQESMNGVQHNNVKPQFHNNSDNKMRC